MWLINNGLEGSELLQELADLPHFHRVFDDRPLNFFHRFSYEPNGIATLIEEEFNFLSKLIFLRHHKDIMHSSSMLYRYDNLCHQFFLIIRRKC
jgi:hypothetical protein